MRYYKIFFLIAIVLTTFIGCKFMDQNKTINFNGKKLELPKNTLVLNLSPWPQDLFGREKIVDASINKTFIKAVFGDYVFDDKIGDQYGHTIFSKVWFEGNTAYAEIRNNLTFRDGRKVTSNDIEYSITRFLVTGDNFTLTTTRNTMIPLVLSNIIGYHKAINSKINKWTKSIISGINSSKSELISFELKEKDYKFFKKLNMGFFPLVDKEQVENHNNHLLNGCGDFKLVKYDKDHDFYLLENTKEKNKHSPKFVAFVFSKDNIGDITTVYQAEKHVRKLEIFVSSNLYTAYGFMFNFKSSLGSDARFRELFEIAIDREAIAKSDVYNRFVPDNQLIANFGDNYKYRIASSNQNKIRAKQLLNELKKDYPTELIGDKLVIPSRFIPYENLESESIFKELISQFQEIGLNIKIENDKYSDLFFNPKEEKGSAIFPVLIFPKILVKESPISNFNSLIPLNTNLSKNSMFENSDENDVILLEKYNSALSNNSNILEFNQYFKSKNIFIVFVNELKNFSYNKNIIKNLGDQSEDFYINLSEIEIN